jgi:outer membrane lipoprotein-sorting protein
MSRPAVLRFSAALLALACAGTAAADARGDLHAAFLKNLSAKTYRATMTDLANGKQVSTVEYQAPDRYRIQVADGPESVIADGAMFLQVNGKPMKVPLRPGMVEQFRSDAAWKQMETDTLIRDAGPGLVGAEPAHKYHWISSGKHASAGDVWVGVKSGYVLQVETVEKLGSKAGVRVVYSDFNDPAIRVLAPN